MSDRVALEPFAIHVEDEVLADLRTRIHNTRWPDQLPGGTWEQGTDLGYLRRLLGYWADGFDWRAQERELNRFANFHAALDGVRIHLVHERAPRGEGVPLVLSHGWPSSFVEMLPLVPLLTDPEAHGIEGPAFDVVIPSLPGYGFSGRPARTGLTTRWTAALWHRLMRSLGYETYGAHGSDFGAEIATFMALDEPSHMLGIHITDLEIGPFIGPSSRSLSHDERAYFAQTHRWAETERGYAEIQSTKPQTLGYALNDSPAGLAAWILEKWRSWSDCGGDLQSRFTPDQLLTNATIYWATQTITSSMRDYYDKRWHAAPLGPNDFIGVPTAVASFAHMLVPEGAPPREWAERLYNVRRWTEMPSGGHFPAVEETERLARDIVQFFGEV